MARMIEECNAHLESHKREALVKALDAMEIAAAAVPNVPRALLPVAVAQFLLESDWGRSGMGDAHNYFGHKARDDDPFVIKRTTEFVEGRPIQVEARFRAYGSMSECFAEHARLICNRTRRDGKKIYAKALEVGDNPVAFAHALTGIYATDPAYGDKLERIMRSRGLLQSFGFREEGRV